ncbi:hypothetical protein FB451DRAFT_1491851 [Mycena latifolia]|nr:hypothetical protein FB451DRAFT_1491851 [Mycena latifolia]
MLRSGDGHPWCDEDAEPARRGASTCADYGNALHVVEWRHCGGAARMTHHLATPAHWGEMHNTDGSPFDADSGRQRTYTYCYGAGLSAVRNPRSKAHGSLDANYRERRSKEHMRPFKHSVGFARWVYDTEQHNPRYVRCPMIAEPMRGDAQRREPRVQTRGVPRPWEPASGTGHTALHCAVTGRGAWGIDSGCDADEKEWPSRKLSVLERRDYVHKMEYRAPSRTAVRVLSRFRTYWIVRTPTRDICWKYAGARTLRRARQRPCTCRSASIAQSVQIQWAARQGGVAMTPMAQSGSCGVPQRTPQRKREMRETDGSQQWRIVTSAHIRPGRRSLRPRRVAACAHARGATEYWDARHARADEIGSQGIKAAKKFEKSVGVKELPTEHGTVANEEREGGGGKQGSELRSDDAINGAYFDAPATFSDSPHLLLRLSARRSKASSILIMERDVRSKSGKVVDILGFSSTILEES